jgi:hypothetical protein
VTALRRAPLLLALVLAIAACDVLATASAAPTEPTELPAAAASATVEPATTPRASRAPQAVTTPKPTPAASAPAAPAAATAPATTPAATPAVLVGDGKWHTHTIQGHEMAIACSGKGRQPVILEHGIGYGVDSASWRTVMSAIAKFAFVCRYDRPFTGRSEPAATTAPSRRSPRKRALS